jgi:hypothetical protein
MQARFLALQVEFVSTDFFKASRIVRSNILQHGRPRRRWDYNTKMDLRMGRCRLDSSGLGYVPMEGSCEHVNEPSGSIKCWEFLEWLRNWQHLKKSSAPWN